MKTQKNTPSVKEVEAMNSTQLRQVASDLNIKSYAKYRKPELLKLVVAELTPKKKVSKSAILRKELKARLNGKMEIDSGSLMKAMESKHNITMHRSFVITVRNSYLELIGAK